MTIQDTRLPVTPAELADRPVRMAVIGTGGMGSYHAMGLKDNPDVDLLGPSISTFRAPKSSPGNPAPPPPPRWMRRSPILASTRS